ncbi:hypothetical protein ABPG75_003054 [Micractinium tetrahymenae]
MAEQQERPQLVLYKWAPGWGLPSLSVACLQVEAYLRLAKIPFAVQDCNAPSAAPTAQLPVLDAGADLVAPDSGAAAAPGPLAEFAAARVMIDYLKQKCVDLDRGLTASQRAEAAAYAALLEGKLQPALLYGAWCEAGPFAAHTRPAYGAGLPFPLSQWAPRATRKALAAHFAATPAAAIYQGAAEALDALALRLGSGHPSPEGGFFFGPQPSSLDAALYACLAFLRGAPVVHPSLAKKLAAHRSLASYVERLGGAAFAAPAPSAADASMDWSAWSGADADDKYSKARSEKEGELQRKGRRWLLCAAGAIAAYIFLSGQYIQFEQLVGYEYEEDEDDE